MKHKLLLLGLLLTSFLYATKTNVTTGTLSSALTSSSNGDTLLLAGGTYASAINFQSGKTLTLKSAGAGSVIFNSTVGGTATDTGCGLIFDGIVINRANSYVVDGSTFGNIDLLAFRNDTIINVNRCLIRGGNTTATNLTTIEITNCIITNCGSSGYAFLYPKFNVSNVTVKKNTMIRYYGGENFFTSQITNTALALNFTFENNTVYKWSKSSSYALCNAAAKHSTSSNYVFRNNIIAVPGITGQKPVTLIATGGNLTAQKNLIVNYGRFTLTTPTAVDTASNHISADLFNPAVGFQDTTATNTIKIAGTTYPYANLNILSTSTLATASTTGGIIGDPRWLKVVSQAATLSTTASPVVAGTTSPASNTVNVGDQVTVTATRAFGYQFKEWRDANTNALVSTSNPYTFTMTGNTSLVAVFSTLTTYNFTVNNTGSGSVWGNVTLTPAPTNGKYEAGTVVSVNAVTNPVTTFLYWEDASTNLTRSITMDADKSLTANFDVIPFIVGWDFKTLTPSASRQADYYADSQNAGVFSLNNADGTSASWLANAGAYSPSLPCARMWSSAASFGTPRYYQATFSTTGYKNIRVNSKVSASYHVYPVVTMQYSVDGTNFTEVKRVDISSAYNATWKDLNDTLPIAADGQNKVYVRWIEDATSTPVLGNATDVDGTSITNAFVYADQVVINDPNPPVLMSSLPAEGSATVSANGSIVLTFNERVQGGTGNCSLGSTVLAPVYGSKSVSFAYSKLTYNTAYSFTVPAGAITDMSGNAFPAFTLHFTTMNRPQPTAKLYDAVVAKDGSGDYTTVAAAVSAAPTGKTAPWLIFIKNGSYKEYVYIPATKPYIYLIGQDKEKTIIHEKLNVQSQPVPTSPWLANDTVAWKFSTNNPAFYLYGTKGSVVWVDASNFYTENIAYVNDWGVESLNGPQALAFTNKGDNTALNNCKLRSFQDTWYTPSNLSYRTYANNCFVEGAVDYVYGEGDAYIENTTLYCNRSGSVIVAPNHETSTKYGYIFQNCTIDGNAAAATGSNALGRPWHNSPITVYMNTKFMIPISTLGWNDMGAIPAIFADYNSMDKNGNLLDLSGRKSTYTYTPSGGSPVTGIAKNRITDTEAATYTYDNVISQTNGWNPRAYFEPVNQPANAVVAGNALSWNASAYAICYVILRNDSVVGFTKQTTYTDQSNTGGSYTYKVKAVNEFGSLSSAATFTNSINTGLVDKASEPMVSVINHSTLKVTNIALDTKISLYSVDGKMLLNDISKSAEYVKLIPNVKGIYILKVGNSSFKVQF